MSSEDFSQEPRQGPDLLLEYAACGQPRPAGTVLYTQQNTQRTQRVCVFPRLVTLGGERKQERSWPGWHEALGVVAGRRKMLHDTEGRLRADKPPEGQSHPFKEGRPARSYAVVIEFVGGEGQTGRAEMNGRTATGGPLAWLMFSCEDLQHRDPQPETKHTSPGSSSDS